MVNIGKIWLNVVKFGKNAFKARQQYKNMGFVRTFWAQKVAYKNR